MSAKFKDIPADEWEQEYCADELKRERKADKSLRFKASNYALAFVTLMEVGGVSPEVHQALHVFLGRTKGHAPDEEIQYFSEREAGALLPGDEGVSDAALRKRFQRAWALIESEQARTGKMFAGRREKGFIRLASRQADEKKKAPRYFSQIAQAVVDTERRAAQMNGLKRDERMRRAALEVWNLLPAYVAPEKVEKVKDSEPKRKSQSGHQTRRANRFEGVVKEMLEAAKLSGADAAQRQAQSLALKLGRVVAEELGVDEESAFRLLAATLQDAADLPADLESECTLSGENLQNPSENRTFEGSHVDRAVHVEASSEQPEQPAKTFCVACGRPLSADRLRVDTERCKTCVESNHWRAGPLREVVKKPEGQDVIYAEDFTV